MRIVIDARESGTGTGRYVDKLVEYLHKLKPGFNIVILVKPHRIQFMNTIAPNFEIVESDIKEFTFKEQLGLWRQLHGLRPDLVHFGMTQQPVLYGGKSITTIHDLTTTRFRNPDKNWLVFTVKQHVYKRVVKRASHKSLRIITPSMFVKKDVAQYANIPANKITVTYEATEKIKATPAEVPKLKPKKFIMYVGRPQPHKNLERFIKAFVLLKESHPDLKLALVGHKESLHDRLQRWIKKNDIPDVVLTGFVSEGQLRWLYENTAAYVFPSLSEGFGLPALESMAHGGPVVSSNATCLPEIYGDGALYFGPTDVADMATKIGQVIDNPKLAKELSEKGFAQASKYSWQRMAEQTLEVYRQALNS